MNIDHGKKKLAEQGSSIEEWTFGSRLSILINKLGMTKKGFAQKVGVAPQTITNYCQDVHGPKHKFVDFVVDHFQVNRDWLTKGTGCIFSWQDAQLRGACDQHTGSHDEILLLQRELTAKDRELAAVELKMGRQQGRIVDAVKATCLRLNLNPEQTKDLLYSVMDYEGVLAESELVKIQQSAAGNE